MSALLTFLNTYNDWQERLAAAPYCVKTTVSADGKFFLLKYNQIESDFNNEIVRECRGCIVAMRNDKWVFACRPFTKFGNAGESYCPEIDWTTASVQQKVDGSLIKFWCWDGEWHISTNGTIDAFDAETGDAVYSNFGELVMLGMPLSMGNFAANADPDYTYMFELTSPFNRVVVPYMGITLWFLGWRNNETGEEFDPDISIMSHFFITPERFPLTSYDEVVAAAGKLDWDYEGFVVCDGGFNRVKIKSPAYVKAHFARNNGVMTDERLMDVVLGNEVAEFLIYAPEYAERVQLLTDCREKFAEYAQTYLLELFGADTRYDSKKDYALMVNHYPSPMRDFLFKFWDGQVFEDYAANWTAAKWIKAFEQMGWL